MAKGQKSEKLYRVVKFEIHPTREQLHVLRKISDNLWVVFNDALAERMETYDTHIAPLYQGIKEATESQDTIRLADLRKDLAEAYKEHTITLFDQINALTPRRARDNTFASIPRNWQEETLDTLDGAFKSFLALRKNGDRDARPPRVRSEWHFCEFPGRYGFRLAEDFSTFTLMCKNVADGVTFEFPIPEYQRMYLGRMDDVKKFTLFRDQPDMRRPGRFWISLASEIQMPAQRPFVPEEAVCISLGASWVGVTSPFGEEVIPLGRPDIHWKPPADIVSDRMKSPHLIKGSRVWRKRNAARQKMLKLMGAQQKLRSRTIVQKLLSHGEHFVVTDLIVRSKKGKLADASKPERGGQLGLNWQAQNTGSIAYLVQWLEEKAKERGGTLRKHRISGEVPRGKGRENKIPMARALRDDFLRTLETA